MKRLPLLFALLATACSGGSSGSAPGQAAEASPSSESAVATTGSQEPAQAPADPGEAVYKKYCIVCHQADGSGKPAGGGRAVAGNFSGPDSVLSKSDKELLLSIKFGRSGKIGVMPKWMAIINEQERKAVLAYIRASFGKAPSSEASGEAPEGTSPEGS